MNAQLELSSKQLKDIGFQAKGRDKRRWYKIDVSEDCIIYYNKHSYLSDYKWYLRTGLMGAHHHSHLDINTAPQLFALLQIFKVKFNLILI